MLNLDIVYLTNFYELLHDNLSSIKKMDNNSILLTFLKTRKNTIYKILKQSKINGHNIPNNILQSLIDKGFIKSFEQFNSYIITSKGVWLIERNRNIINENILLTFINDEFFSKGIKDDNLDDTEKVILFSMILGRSFCKKSSVSLKNSNIIKDKWLEILEKSYSILYDLNFISYKKDKIFSGTINVHVVSSMFRHNNDMVEKTLGIYDYTGNQEYYLNIYNNNYFDDEKLSYLFYKLFNGNLNNEKIKIINKVCNEISRNYSIYLYNVDSHIFILPEYDLKIKDSLNQSLLLYK